MREGREEPWEVEMQVVVVGLEEWVLEGLRRRSICSMNLGIWLRRIRRMS